VKENRQEGTKENSRNTKNKKAGTLMWWKILQLLKQQIHPSKRKSEIKAKG
jgi:hypothetical protein